MRREFVEPATIPRDLLDALEEIAEAAPWTGWQDVGGPCWCAEAVELTGRPHIDRCARMRAALARLSAARQAKEDV